MEPVDEYLVPTQPFKTKKTEALAKLRELLALAAEENADSDNLHAIVKAIANVESVRTSRSELLSGTGLVAKYRTTH